MWYNEETAETISDADYSKTSGGGAVDGSGGSSALATVAYCDECSDVAAARWCEDCQLSFCVDCFMANHTKDPAKRNHTFQNM